MVVHEGRMVRRVVERVVAVKKEDRACESWVQRS